MILQCVSYSREGNILASSLAANNKWGVLINLHVLLQIIPNLEFPMNESIVGAVITFPRGNRAESGSIRGGSSVQYLLKSRPRVASPFINQREDDERQN